MRLAVVLFIYKKLPYMVLLFPTVIFSQINVSGRILDIYNNPIELGQVTFINQDSIIQTAYTDSRGLFIVDIPANTYRIKINKNGVLIFEKTVDAFSDTDLGDIISEDLIELDEIVIEQKKKLIERKIDRLIFNVENSISLTGSDASEVLRSTPGVRVQNNDIKIIGKSSMMIMIDDRIVELAGEDLINFLKTIPSESIKSIEVITAPPAKYDASGNSGLLNIKLKKAKEDSWNSTIGTTFTQRTYFSEALLGNFNYNKGKLTIQSSLNLGNSISKYSDKVITYYSDETWSEEIPRKITNKNIGYRLATDYELSPKWSMGIIVTGSNTNVNSTENSRINRLNVISSDLESFVNSDLTSSTKPFIFSANYHNIVKLDTIGTKFIIDIDYFDYNNFDKRSFSGNQFTDGYTVVPESYFAVTTYNNQSIDNYSGKVDAEMPVSWATISFGGKVSKTISKNNLEYYDLETFEPILDQDQSNKFDYRENNQALYFSANKKIGEKWEVQAALRGEATQTVGYSQNYNQKNKNDYIKLFPTIYVQYVANQNNTYSINYNKRILRPNYNLLNPFKVYDSPYSYLEGNPFLQPSFSNNIEFNYSYKNLDSKLSYNQVDSGFEQFGVVDPVSKITRYTVFNFLNTKSYSISLIYTFNKFKWWTSITSLDNGYSNSRSSNNFTDNNVSGSYTFISTNNDFILNSSNSLKLNVSYWYQFKSTIGVYSYEPYGSFSLGIRYNLKNNLQLSFSANDIFRSQISKYSNYSSGIKNEFTNYYDAQHIRFSIQYKFGNTKLKSINKESGNTEDQNRLK